MNAPKKLPPDVLDDVLRRLVATYGRRFWAQYEGVEVSDVRAVWARELAGYTDRPESLRFAFENLPEAPPNAIEFRNLCRRAPAPPVPALPAPVVDPAVVRNAIAQANAILAQMPPSKTDWVEGVAKRLAAGEPVSYFVRHAVKDMAAPSQESDTPA